MKITVEHKLADLWIGAFWRRSDEIFHLWICLVPCFPVHLQLWRKDSVVGQAVHLHRAVCRGEKTVEDLRAELSAINAHPTYSPQEEQRVLALQDVLGGFR